MCICDPPQFLPSFPNHTHTRAHKQVEEVGVTEEVGGALKRVSRFIIAQQLDNQHVHTQLQHNLVGDQSSVSSATYTCSRSCGPPTTTHSNSHPHNCALRREHNATTQFNQHATTTQLTTRHNSRHNCTIQKHNATSQFKQDDTTRLSS